MTSQDDYDRLRRASAGEEVPRDFAFAKLSKARFSSFKLAGVNFERADLRSADASGSYLSCCNFAGANLTKACLVMADLRDANLAGAKLKNANLSSAVLAGASLVGADLTNCRLTKAMMARADLTGADLAGADFRGVRDMTPEQLRAARNWQAATCDAALARAIDVVQDEATSRYGSHEPAHDCLCVDVLTGEMRPTFGDVFLLTGDEHPQFTPSGACDLSALASIGFEQADDFFAIRLRGEEVIWLKPIEHHQTGTCQALRLELGSRSKAAGERFVRAVTAFVEFFGGGLQTVSAGGRPGEPLTLELLQQQVTAATSRRKNRK
jgi:hypothetical protein